MTSILCTYFVNIHFHAHRDIYVRQTQIMILHWEIYTYRKKKLANIVDRIEEISPCKMNEQNTAGRSKRHRFSSQYVIASMCISLFNTESNHFLVSFFFVFLFFFFFGETYYYYDAVKRSDFLFKLNTTMKIIHQASEKSTDGRTQREGEKYTRHSYYMRNEGWVLTKVIVQILNFI